MSLSHYDAPNGSYTSSIPPGTQAFRTFIAQKFGFTRTEVIRDKSRCNHTRSEHCECGAIDFFTTVTVKGRAVFDWCVKHEQATGVQSVIFQHRQIGFGNPTERHRDKADHLDHVHVGLNRWARANLTLEMLQGLDEEEDDMAQVPQAEWDKLLEDFADVKSKMNAVWKDHGDLTQNGTVYVGVLEGVRDLDARLKGIEATLAYLRELLAYLREQHPPAPIPDEE